MLWLTGHFCLSLQKTKNPYFINATFEHSRPVLQFVGQAFLKGAHDG